MTYFKSVASRDSLPDAAPFSSLSVRQQKLWAVKNPIPFFRYVNSLPYDAAMVAKYPFYKTKLCTFLDEDKPSNPHFNCSFAHDIAEEWLYGDFYCQQIGKVFHKHVCANNSKGHRMFCTLDLCPDAHSGQITIVHNPTRLAICP